MKITANAHTHTVYCDGSATPREMAQAAVAAGLEALGFSGHAPMTAMGEGWTMEKGRDLLYRQDVAAVRAEFKGRLAVYCGVEWDLYASGEWVPYDYVIGSIHVMRCADGALYSFDDTVAEMERCKHLGFGGDGEAIPRYYYRYLREYLTAHPAFIVGHFDLVRKFNRHNVYFDETSAAYQQLAMETMTALAKGDRIFEVNTAGLCSGHLGAAYPDDYLLAHLHDLGGRVMLSSDAHTVQTLTYGFAETLQKLKKIGFKYLTVLTPHGFDEKRI